jgi:hypothetical protein
MKKDNKKVNGVNKKDNYAITFKIDADVEDYLRNITWINFIESRIETNMNKYINELIRGEMLNLLGLSKNASSDEIKSKWYEYKRKNNL